MNRGRLLRLLVAVVLLAALAASFHYRKYFDNAALEHAVQSAGAAAPLLFMGVYALATVLLLPGSVLTLAGGALFGPILGTFYCLTGATLGAVLAFVIARYLAGDWATRKAGPRLAQLASGVEAEGWRFVAFVRLVPVFPFNLLNYALGLTRIRFLHYLLATYVCMLPGAFAYTYLGFAGREAMAGGDGLIQKALLALALFGSVAFLPSLVRRLRAPAAPTLDIPALRSRIAEAEAPLVLDVRDDAEFRAGHIEGARGIPLPQLATRIAELDAWRTQPVAVICHTDRRSRDAVAMLSGAGFTEVYLVLEGMRRWKRDGLPIAAE